MDERIAAMLAALNAWADRWPATRIVRDSVRGFVAHDVLQYAGGMAYFAVLSLFQVLVLGIVIGSLLLGEARARELVVEWIGTGGPVDADVVGQIVEGTLNARGGMTVLSVAFLAWGGLGFFSALARGVGRAFEGSPRAFLAERLTSLILFGVVGALVVASIVIGIAAGILEGLTTDLGAPLLEGVMAWVVGVALPFALAFVAFAVTFRVVPTRPVAWSQAAVGAVVAAAGWTLLRSAFTWFATRVASYGDAFGPLSAAISLLVFLYLASVVILVGAEVARAATVEREA